MRPIPGLILTHARIRTLNKVQPFVQALAVGTVADGVALAGPGTRVLNLHGRAVLPGLIDSHAHGLWGACRDLFEVFAGLGAPLADVLAGVAAKVAQTAPGAWVVGGPWRPFQRASFGPRPADLLDAVAPADPVLLKDVSQHNYGLNSAALAAAGITAATPDPAGGHVERDATGAPTAILTDSAVNLVSRFQDPTPAQLAQALGLIAGYFHSLGLTGFKEPMAFAPELATQADADRAARRNLHVAAHLTRFSPFNGDWVPMDVLAALRAAPQGPHLHTAFAKLFPDGVPIARTATFCDPLPGDDPATHDPQANLLIAPDRLATKLVAQDAAGDTVKRHAAGDRAVQASRGAIAAARAVNGASDLRHEIAHANFIRPSGLARFAELDAVAEVLPKLCYPGPVTPGQRQVLGDARVASCHPVRAVLDANPWTGLVGMITRADPTGVYPGHVGADQAIGPDRAIAVFTTNAARALRLDHLTGRLAAGFSTDQIVLDRAPETMSPADLGATRSLATLCEGHAVHGDV